MLISSTIHREAYQPSRTHYLASEPITICLYSWAVHCVRSGIATISIWWYLAWLWWIHDTSHFALETSMLTKHSKKRVSRYFHSWYDSTYNKTFIVSIRGFSVLWSIWNIQIDILYLSAPTYLYQFLNIGAKVLLIVEYRVIEYLLLNANLELFQLYHGENKLNFQWDDDDDVH